MCRVKSLSLAMAVVVASAVIPAEAGPGDRSGLADAEQSGLRVLPLSYGSEGSDAAAPPSRRPEIPAPSTPTTTTTTAPPTTTTAPPTTTTTAPPPPPPPPPPATAFVCPVQGQVTFVDSFGWPRSGGRSHQGIDMMAASGVPTVAPVGGQVEHSESALGGMSWRLHADDGHVYYGAHLSSYENVGVGWVAAGTVIGYVGDSGNASGTPHLHFEFHPGGGEAANPYPKVAEAC